MSVAPYDKSIICPVLIGREKDLELLTRLIEQSAHGRGHIALIAGEAGIGKSRLVSEAMQRARERGLRILVGHCFETDRVFPYAPFADLLRSYFGGHLPANPTPEIAALAPEFAKIAPALTTFTPSPALDPEREKRRLFQALEDFFSLQSNDSPQLVLIEDLHWADDTSVEFLVYLTRKLHPQPRLLLLTYRSDEVNPSLRHFLAELDRERSATELTLARLSEEQIDAMLRATFALNRPVRIEFLHAIYALTEGNPFFIEEVLKSLIVAGDIFYTDGAWDRKPITELRIPRSVQDALSRRTGHLSQDAKDLLSLASAIGQRFDFSLLQDLVPEKDIDLLPPLKELIHEQLIVEESPDRFAFRHALTREAVYSELMGRERMRLHLMIGESLERTGAAAPDLSYHFYNAGAWVKALAYSKRAGEKAQALYSPRAAIEQYTRAINAADRLDAPRSAELLRERGGAYEILGDFENARSDMDMALVASRSQSDRQTEWDVLIDLGKLWTSRDYSKSGEYFQIALKCAREMEDPSKIAHSLNRFGNWSLNLDRPSEARSAHEEALNIFRRLGDRSGMGETSDLLGMASWIGGDLEQATTYHQQAVELFRELNNRQGLVSSLATLAVRSGSYKTETLMFPTQKLSDSNDAGEEALEIARAIDWRAGESFALWCLGAALAAQGEYGRALQLTQESLAIAEETEHQQWTTACNCMLGGIYSDLFAFSQATSHLERAMALARDIGSLHWIRVTTGRMALANILQNDLEHAQSVLDDALPLGAPMDSVGKRLCWLARGELALARGDANSALKIADDLIADSRKVIPRLWKLRGDALAAKDSPEAEIVFLDAIRTSTEQGALPLLWRIQVALGKSFHSEERLDAARTVVEEIAANVPQGSLRENFLLGSHAQIPAARVRTPLQIAKQEFGGLTMREREIAAMIAQGKSNREIAQALVVSERTVETHVTNVLTKLGFDSRTRIAAWAVGKKLGG